MRRTRLTTVLTTSAITSAVLVSLPATSAATPGQGEPGSRTQVPVQLIAMNDFHGRISEADPSTSDAKLTAPGPDGLYGTPDDTTETVGGSANVSSTVTSLEQQFRASAGADARSYFIGAGDLISASTFESSVYKDEPTIEVLNAMGLDASSVGNHEFDRGTEELRRISAATDGSYTDDVSACAGVTVGVDGCFGDRGHEFHGADFPYLAANVISTETGEPMLPPYQVFDAGAGRKVALIGVVTRTTATIVSPTGIADVTFIDEADAVNHWSKVLTRQGIKAIGVVVHEGGTNDGADELDPNGCAGLTGPIVDINDRIDDRVDLIVSAHTHQAYNCLLPVPGGQPRLVTQAGYYGRLVTDIRLTLNSKSGDVDRSATYQAANVPVLRNAPDPVVADIVAYWNQRADEAGNVVVGTVNGDLLRARDAAGAVVRNDESVLGTFVANAQLASAATRPELGGPVVAFMNPGGLRTDITGGEVTYRELFAVQPFSNTVNALTLTGAAVDDVLEQQFRGAEAGADLVLSTSDGFTYQYNRSLPEGERVLDCFIRIGADTVSPTGTYRVAANSFLTAGGDGFTAFTTGTDQVTGPVDVDTAVAYLQGRQLDPPAGDHAVPVTTSTCG